jgi:hypothetical protein
LPLSGLWIIGLFVGIEMPHSGVSWVMLGLAVCSGTRASLPTRRKRQLRGPSDVALDGVAA